MRTWITSLIIVLAALFLRAQAAPPNVLVILTDDQGWGDLSINGNTNLATPNIDSLARDGTTLENFYVCQVCAPTRAEFLTGRDYARTGVSGVSRGQGRLNPDETTLANVFKANGYATGAFGKWHNGTQSPYHPNDRGFDEYYGFTSGHWGAYFSPPLDHNGEKVRGKGFVVDDFTEHAMAFIESNRASPFFCYVPFNTPHSPMMVDDRFYDKFENADLKQRARGDQKEDIMMTRAALAMCENIDWNVGRLLRKLDALGLRDNTIVLYFSDNGPNSYRWNGEMKGRKGSIDEGGVRSPFFIRWPGHIPAGRTIPDVVGAIDLLPTLSDLTGTKRITRKPLDGRSFSNMLLDPKAALPPRTLFSFAKGKVSSRTQQFRLDAAGKLYDIEKDRGQRTDLSAQHPEVCAMLKKQAAEHLKTMTADVEAYRDRPFAIGYGRHNTLPVRDGIEHGSIRRSAKPPNNSFFTHWTNLGDSITWDIDVGTSGSYLATVYYTCAAGNEGANIVLGMDEGASISARVTEVFDPPLYDKSKERVANSHYFVKDFKPLQLGGLTLQQGRATLRLSASNIPGKACIDVHSIELKRASP
jgi:arylsulfatase A-like enzyme